MFQSITNLEKYKRNILLCITQPQNKFRHLIFFWLETSAFDINIYQFFYKFCGYEILNRTHFNLLTSAIFQTSNAIQNSSIESSVRLKLIESVGKSSWDTKLTVHFDKSRTIRNFVEIFNWGKIQKTVISVILKRYFLKSIRF